MFAAAHVYWALGGSVGLAESAGADLAAERPTWFVVGGLYGVAVLLSGAAVLGVVLGRRALSDRSRRVLRLLVTALAALLLAPAVVVELVLLADPGYGGGAVSRDQRYWTLVLWNPWFLVGGTFFGVAAMRARRPPGKPSRR